jgi:hypothetical protein
VQRAFKNQIAQIRMYARMWTDTVELALFYNIAQTEVIKLLTNPSHKSVHKFLIAFVAVQIMTNLCASCSRFPLFSNCALVLICVPVLSQFLKHSLQTVLQDTSYYLRNSYTAEIFCILVRSLAKYFISNTVKTNREFKSSN